jgi:hypothetical protein
MSSNITSLSFPKEWVSPTSTQRMFKDLPFVGLEKKVHDSICHQLELRSQICLSLWSDYSISVLDIRESVSQLIRDYFGWPNTLYIPEDPCDVLLWSPGDGMLSVEAMCVIQEKYSTCIDWESLKFGDLLYKLVHSSA